MELTTALESSSVLNLERLVAELSEEGRQRFERLFHVVTTHGEIRPPVHMTRWIERYFGSVDVISRQRVVKVTNKATLEGALFNDLRARRPLEARIPAALHEELGRSAPDPFCEALVNTPEDVFGRIKGKCCVTASNIAKYDGWHGVIVFSAHDPLAFDEESVADYIAVAQEWWRQAHAADAEAIYPLFMWNCLWKAGASIPHGHAQMSLTKGMHYAKIEQLRRSAHIHRMIFQQNYFDEIFTTHRDLGLGIDWHGIRVLANLVPVKEKETVLFGPALNEYMVAAIYRALHCLTVDLGVTSFNLVIYMPPLGEIPGEWADFPVVVRIVDRGDPMNRTADFGSMELYAASVVSSDPFRVAESLFRAFNG